MLKKLSLTTTLIIFISLLGGLTISVFAQSEAGDFLCEVAVKYYKKGDMAEALHEFKKVLIIDPQNQLAQKYLKMITQKSVKQKSDYSYAPKVMSAVSREELINKTLSHYNSEPWPKDNEINVNGQLQLGFGIEAKDFIWNRANADLNEKNWRIMSDEVFNRRENTYDPAIYDRLNLNVETPQDKNGLGFHANISIDPWAFTGETQKITLAGAGGDSAEVQLRSWGSTGYTLNGSVYTLSNGDTFSLPEIKIKNGKTVATTIRTTWGNYITIPEMNIHDQFQPLRELWIDYKQDDYLKLHMFPLATEKEAYTSDDPLGLSNRHIYWSDSPWLRRWQKGNYNSGATPISFSKGYWDNSTSFSAKDSSGARLTQLRGFSFEMKPQEKTQFSTTWATPKDPWQDYSDVDNIGGATRLQNSTLDNFRAGLLHTLRIGFADNKEDTDALNQVLSGDIAYEMIEGAKLSAQAAVSKSGYDLTNDQYKTESRGNAYYVSLINRYPQESIIDSTYDQIKPGKDDTFISKSRLFFAHMDRGFEPALADYRGTRQDAFWSRHLHFHQPFEYFSQGLNAPPLKFDDIIPYAVGDGIDIGRDVVGLRWEISLEKNFSNLFDIRNVNDVNGRYIETETRDEMTWKITDQLTAKALGLYQHLPKTKEGLDPFLYDSRTGTYLTDWSATPIKGDLDPSLKTGSAGLEYAFTDWLKVNGVYERTNDYSLAYGNFPRGDLNSSQPSDVYYEYGNTYLRNRNFLYDQQLFPQPPYPFYNVYKAGLTLTPIDKLELYFDYTRSDFKDAGQVSDSMNHFGAEISYLPSAKLGFYLRYTYSLWRDLDKLRSGDTGVTAHHNIFAALRYKFSKDDELTLEFGVSPNYSYITDSTTYDPYGGSLVTIDTQHIVRVFYRRKF
ncbi:MAG: hypothetical protein NTY14_01745 [Candidatus Omnitrophica bacterium]|nr:hypothetical protein [Candidatus Omnitrophota bacterium]